MVEGTKVRTLATAEDPTLKRSFRGHKDTILAVCFNPNMKQVASASQDSTITVWNFKPQQRPFKFAGHKGPVHDVTFSPHGSLIASASKDETVRLWQNTVEANSVVLKAHNATVRSVNFSSDGKLLLTSSDDKSLKVWNVADRRFIYSLTGHSNWVRTAHFSPDSRLVGSGADDKTVKIWDTEQRSEIHTFSDHSGIITSVKFHPDGTCIASGSHDKKIKIWDVRSKRLIQHYDAHADCVNQISFHPSGYYLLSASNDAKLKVWDLRQGRLSYTLYGHEGAATAAAFSQGGDYFASGGADNLVLVWKSNFEEKSGEIVDEVPSPSKGGVSLLKSNKRPLTANTNKENRTFNTAAGTQKQQTQGGLDGNTFTFSPKKAKASLYHQTQSPGETKATKPEKSKEIYFSTQERAFQSTTNFPKGEEEEADIEEENIPPELATTLAKITDQLDVLTKTLQVLEMRIGVNEENIAYLGKLVSTQKGTSFLEDDNFKKTTANLADNVFVTGALHPSQTANLTGGLLGTLKP